MEKDFKEENESKVQETQEKYKSRPYAPFIQAIVDGSANDVNILWLDKELDPNMTTPDASNNAMHYAAVTNDIKLMEKLLCHKDILVNMQNKDGNTPLHFAVDRGHTEMVELLVNNEFVNFDIQNKRGETPEAITQQVTNGKQLLKLFETARQERKKEMEDMKKRIPEMRRKYMENIANWISSEYKPLYDLRIILMDDKKWDFKDSLVTILRSAKIKYIEKNE